MTNCIGFSFEAAENGKKMNRDEGDGGDKKKNL
jgi:hypothetical protein